MGILQSYGTAEGFEVGIKKAINDNLRFQLTTSFYYWGKPQDINLSTFYPSNYDSHIRREMNLLIPLRLGFNFKFGNSNSHPYLSMEWVINYLKNDIYTPIPTVNSYSPIERSYEKSSENTIFVSLGFSMGYTFYLSDDVNIISGMNWQSGKSTQFVGFTTGIEYKL